MLCLGVLIPVAKWICARNCRELFRLKRQLKNIPIVFNVDFGHVFPFATFPIGGTVKINTSCKEVSLEILNH